MCVHVYVRMYMYVCMYVYMHACMCMHACMYVYACLNVCMNVCMSCIQTCMYSLTAASALWPCLEKILSLLQEAVCALCLSLIEQLLRDLLAVLVCVYKHAILEVNVFSRG